MAGEGSLVALSAGERGLVVFKLWKSLPYGRRMLLSLSLIVAGLAVQAAANSFWPGAPLVFAGNLFLLVTGYHNRVEFGKWDPAAQWETVAVERLGELMKMDRRIRDWDVSALDVTNTLGALVFLIVVGALTAFSVVTTGLPQTVFLDGLLLLVPHWVTGVRSVLVLPNLIVKARALWEALAANRRELGDHKVDAMVLLKGRDKKLPDDVKFRVGIKGAAADFLGLYGQAVINMVQGTSYPYFYVVLVSRKGFGLARACASYSPPENVTKEFKTQDDVEVLVIRQTTTRTSGYHTSTATGWLLLKEGLRLAEQVARRG